MWGHLLTLSWNVYHCYEYVYKLIEEEIEQYVREETEYICKLRYDSKSICVENSWNRIESENL